LLITQLLVCDARDAPANTWWVRSAVRGLRDAVIVRTAAQLAGGAFAADDLQRCTLWLLGPMAALRLARLRNCRVLGGPVAGATFADGALTAKASARPEPAGCRAACGTLRLQSVWLPLCA